MKHNSELINHKKYNLETYLGRVNERMKTQAQFAIRMKPGKKPRNMMCFSDIWVNRKELSKLNILKNQDTFSRAS